MSKEPPIGIALVLCDQILQDAQTGKRSLIGLFNAVRCRDFPATLHQLCVFVSLTQINGPVKTILRCSNETLGQTLLEVPGTATSADPNGILELGFEFAKFSVPNPGLYNFEFFGDDALILQTRFLVERISTK